jgi:hypothetical protein
MAESKLDSESWGIVYSHLSTHEVLRLNVTSKTTKILLERGVLSPIKVKHLPHVPQTVAFQTV